MNYANFNQTYGSAKPVAPARTMYDDVGESYRDKTNSFHNEPDFLLYDEDKKIAKKRKGHERANEASRGVRNGISEDIGEENMDPVTELFFSTKNVRRVQRMIREEIARRTHGEYILEDDQDESDLLVSMRAVIFGEDGGRYLPFKVKEQVKKLNYQTVQYVVPDMISNIKQYYSYLNDINKPRDILPLPLNVNNAGRRTLASISTIWEL